ncbi:MAG: hypothetical protein J6C34_09210 [Oscillospiraceae bacterium]|nr:hypothetical protein [Oscillospiraceae bacterium]
MQNILIRKKIKESGLKQWGVAYALGINESTLTRWLRVELPEKEKERICSVVDELLKIKKEE